MSTVTKWIIAAVAVAACCAAIIVASRPADVSHAPLSPTSAAQPDLHRLELNPLGTLGAPGRLRSVAMPHPSKLTSLPAEMMVYKVVPAVVTLASVEKEAKRFGVAGKARRNGDMTMVKGTSGDVVVDNESGSVNWITPAYESAATPMRQRLTDDEYIARATEFLKSRDLWRDDLVFTGISQYTVEQRPMMVEVNFGRSLNGSKWQGVGPKRTVAFGDEGRIVGYFSVWREVKPLTVYPLVKPSDAIRQIEQGDALVGTDEMNVDATAESVELVYMNDGAGVQQLYVAPYFKVSGRTASGKPFSAVTRAIPLRFVNERPEELPGRGGTPESTGRTE